MTRYLTGHIGKAVRPHLDSRELGVIVTPNMWNKLDPSWIWAADNGCFNADTYVGDDAWFTWLSAKDPTYCLFAVAPDVVADAVATLARSAPWLPRIRELGYPAALVAQNGLEELSVPWETFDVLFIGGDTDWKLGHAAAGLAFQAKGRGKRVHVGRVNSLKRLQRAQLIGADTADGTFLAFAPDTNVPRLMHWVEQVAWLPALPIEAGA